MRKLTILALLLAGFLAHKAVWEAVQVRVVREYESCMANVEPTEQLSRYQQCESKLRLNKYEGIILYQYNFWCRYDSMNCEDRD